MREPSWSIPGVALHVGDCLDVLKEMPDASVDAVVTDPPAGIGFMGKEWDDFRRARNPADAGRDNVFGRTSARGPEYGRRERQAFVSWLTKVMVEVHRVLKPGGHGLVWAIPRTSHWTATALEDAGFTIRDCVVHLFGSGFPKSLNVGGGRGTALKPGQEHWWLVRKSPDGTVAANVVKHGTGALNIDGCRIGSADKLVRPAVQRRDNDVYGKGLGAGVQDEPVGRWPTNLVFSHSPECVEGYECDADCPVAELDRQSGVTRDGVATNRNRSGVMPRAIYGQMNVPPPVDVGYGGSGGASRFFPTFRYEAKAPASERPKLPDGTAWPTVKPLALMRWLVRLVTPPNGVVLDPFAGTGTTGEAALIEGFRSVLVERDPAAVELIKTRFAKPIAPTLDLFGEETSHA